MLIFLFPLLILILNLTLIFLLLIIKENGIELYIHCISSYLIHIFPYMCFSPLLTLILFQSLFSDTASNLSWHVTMKNEMHILEQNETKTSSTSNCEEDSLMLVDINYQFES